MFPDKTPSVGLTSGALIAWTKQGGGDEGEQGG